MQLHAQDVTLLCRLFHKPAGVEKSKTNQRWSHACGNACSKKHRIGFSGLHFSDIHHGSYVEPGSKKTVTVKSKCRILEPSKLRLRKYPQIIFCIPKCTKHVKLMKGIIRKQTITDMHITAYIEKNATLISSKKANFSS